MLSSRAAPSDCWTDLPALLAVCQSSLAACIQKSIGTFGQTSSCLHWGSVHHCSSHHRVHCSCQVHNPCHGASGGSQQGLIHLAVESRMYKTARGTPVAYHATVMSFLVLGE